MNKQIEEMAKALTRYEYSLCKRLPKDKCLLTSAVHAQVSCDYCKIAEFLVNEGYRKKEDVAREIMNDIDKILGMLMVDYVAFNRFSEADTIHYAIYYLLDELKKKYGVTEE